MPRPGELREMDEDVLIRHLRTARQELFGLRFRHATGELENTAGMRSARRELARALTVARERGLDPDRAVPAEPEASE